MQLLQIDAGCLRKADDDEMITADASSSLWLYAQSSNEAQFKLRLRMVEIGSPSFGDRVASQCHVADRASPSNSDVKGEGERVS